MRMIVNALVLSLPLAALCVGAASAQHTNGQGPTKGVGHVSHGNGNGYGHAETATSVPELDPAAAGAPLVLLAGGAALLLSRRRRSARSDA